jgi:Uma2 family endonuclease
VAIQDQRPATVGDSAPFDPSDTTGYLLPPPAPVPWDDFLAWLDESGRAEWVAGEIIEIPPASEDHQDNGGFLFPLLLLHIQRHRLGRLFYAPFLMRLPEKPSGREPDLMFVSAAHRDRIRPTFLDGPADLVVEIVSPESVAQDYGDKLAEYEAAGIPEYWIIDPLRQDARFYQLGEDGTYRPAMLDANGVYTSREVPSFRLRVSWLWQRPLPTIDEALADLPPS